LIFDINTSKKYPKNTQIFYEFLDFGSIFLFFDIEKDLISLSVVSFCEILIICIVVPEKNKKRLRHRFDFSMVSLF